MTIGWQILLAFGLDLALGDPRWAPHPARSIGRFATWLEAPMRRLVGDPWRAGVATAAIVVGASAGAAWGSLWLAARVHPALGVAASVWLLYWSLAARDLAAHAMAVERPLRLGAEGLPEARALVGRIVGRDVTRLDERGVARAAIESVAENAVDGVTAPLFFAALGGPVAVWAYKAASTLDSTFGYKNERYIQFGWASARLDDAANFIPARLTLPIMALAAALLGQSGAGAWRSGLAGRRKHASPNSGIPEAAMAGALNVELGGPLEKHGNLIELPILNEGGLPPRREHLRHAVALMLGTSILTTAIFVGARWIAQAAMGR